MLVAGISTGMAQENVQFVGHKSLAAIKHTVFMCLTYDSERDKLFNEQVRCHIIVGAYSDFVLAIVKLEILCSALVEGMAC